MRTELATHQEMGAARAELGGARRETNQLLPLRLAALVNPTLFSSVGAALGYVRTSAAIYEDYDGSLHKASAGRPAFTGARTIGDGVYSLFTAEGLQIHPVEQFTFKGQRIPRLAHYAPWAAATAKVAGHHVAPGNGYYYTALDDGTTHATTEPIWPTTIGQTVVDNGITWTCSGLYQDKIGLLVEPAGTNKCQCESFPPADDLQPNGWAGPTIGVAGFTDLGGGRYQCDGTDGASIYVDGIITQGKKHRVTFEIESTTGGELYMFSGSEGTVPVSGVGVHTEDKLQTSATGGRATLFSTGGGFTGIVKAVSVQDIKWAVGTYATAALPTSIPGFTCSGAGSGLLRIATADAAAEAKDGQLPGWAGKMWQLDNSAAGADFFVLVDGVTGNINKHSPSVYWSGSGNGYMNLTGGALTPVALPTGVERFSRENQTPVDGTKVLYVGAAAAGVVNFTLPQLEESAYATSPIITHEGQTGTRAAVDVQINAFAPNDMTMMIDVIYNVLGAGVDHLVDPLSGDNRVRLYKNASDQRTMEKRVGGVSVYGIDNANTPSVGTVSREAGRMSSSDGIHHFADGIISPVSSANTTDAVPSAPQYVGGATTTPANCLYKNLFVFHAIETDANMQEVTGYDA